MSKTKFTPSPWHIIETASTRSKGQSDYLLANKSPHVHGVITGPMLHADLALIAAAPSMFEALEQLWTCVANGVDCDPEKWREATKLTQDALEKARGEA